MDESGHHGGDGYEVRGGIALKASSVWRFTRQMRGLESHCFGTLLQVHGKELKAVKLLERKRLRISTQIPYFDDVTRKRLCGEYFGQARNRISPTLEHNIAYSQAGRLFVSELLPLISRSGARIFASVVPSKHLKAPQQVQRNFVRRDLTYLMGAFYYFLEEQNEDGLIVMDETDRSDDKRFLQRLERYFSLSEKGKQHARLILPTPLFTGSDMSYPVQAADIICYLISQAFRLPEMHGPSRTDLDPSWIEAIKKMEFKCNRTVSRSGIKTHHSIVYVANPWKGAKIREGKTHLQNDS